MFTYYCIVELSIFIPTCFWNYTCVLVEINITTEFTSKAVILGAVTLIKDQINIPKEYNILFKNNTLYNIMLYIRVFWHQQLHSVILLTSKFVKRLINHDAAVFNVEPGFVT